MAFWRLPVPLLVTLILVAAVTTPVGAEVAEPEPAAFVAVTTTRIVVPASLEPTL
jgi:hypothetical protein